MIRRIGLECSMPRVPSFFMRLGSRCNLEIFLLALHLCLEIEFQFCIYDFSLLQIVTSFPRCFVLSLISLLLLKNSLSFLDVELVSLSLSWRELALQFLLLRGALHLV